MRSRSMQFGAVAFLAVALGLSACRDPAGPEADGALQVRAFSRGFAQAMGAPSGEVSAIEIERVYVVLGRLKLEKAADGTEDFTDERSIVIELGPGTEPVLAIAADVPLGEYKEIELAIDKLERGHPTEEALIEAYPGLEDASLLIEGTFTRDGGEAESFSFAAALDIDLEVAFTPSLTIDTLEPGVTLLSLVLDGSEWFRSPSGELLRPTAEASRSMIEAAIQKSIELFEDSNRDGRK